VYCTTTLTPTPNILKALYRFDLHIYVFPSIWKSGVAVENFMLIALKHLLNNSEKKWNQKGIFNRCFFFMSLSCTHS